MYIIPKKTSLAAVNSNQKPTYAADEIPVFVRAAKSACTPRDRRGIDAAPVGRVRCRRCCTGAMFHGEQSRGARLLLTPLDAVKVVVELLHAVHPGVQDFALRDLHDGFVGNPGIPGHRGPLPLCPVEVVENVLQNRCLWGIHGRQEYPIWGVCQP